MNYTIISYDKTIVMLLWYTSDFARNVASTDNVSIYQSISLVWRQKGLTGYCFKYTDKPLCLQADDL